MKFSVIVPVYNTEKYLEPLLQSIVSQNTSGFEIVIVNDGSTDSSLEICQKYAKLFDYIKIIDCENRGVSAARNIGINHCTGEYITFLDSDDSINEGYFDKLINIVQNNSVELINFAYEVLPEASIASIPTVNGCVDKNSFLCELFKSKWGHWAPWCNVFKRDIIIDNKIRFDESLRGCEDCEFLFRYLKFVDKVFVSDFPSVKYIKFREGSITKEYGSKYYDDLVVYNRIMGDKYYNQNKNCKEFFSKRIAKTLLFLKNDENVSDNLLLLKESVRNISFYKDPKILYVKTLSPIIGTKGLIKFTNVLKGLK